MKPLRGLPAQIVGYMSHHHVWHSKGTLTADIVWKHTQGRNYGKRYLPETVGRALRLLEEKSIIAVKEQGISVQYKWIPHEMRKRYIPSSSRPMGWENVLFKLADHKYL